MEGDDKRSEGLVDKAKGRVEQAGGDLTDDEDLKAKGKTDEAKGTVKDAAGRIQNAAEDLTK